MDYSSARKALAQGNAVRDMTPAKMRLCSGCGSDRTYTPTQIDMAAADWVRA